MRENYFAPLVRLYRLTRVDRDLWYLVEEREGRFHPVAKGSLDLIVQFLKNVNEQHPK